MTTHRKRRPFLLLTLALLTHTAHADPVSELSAEASQNEILLTWLNPSNGDHAGVLILRQTGTAVTASPVNGESYTAGQQLGADDVIYLGPGADDSPDNPSAFSDSALLPLTTYHYALFAVDTGSNYAAGVTVSATTSSDTAPPSPVSDLQATGITNAIALTWTNPPESDFTAITILGRAGSPPTGSLSNGIAYPVGTIVGDAEVVYAASTIPSSSGAWTNTGLASSETRSYAIFAHDNVPNYSTPATATATSADLIPPDPVSALQALAGVRQLTLRWNNPTNADFAGILVVHRADGLPSATPTPGVTYTPGTALGNGDVVYAGPATPATPGAAAEWIHSGLESGSRHGYLVFAYDAPRNYANPSGSLGTTAPTTPVVWLTFTNTTGSVVNDDSGNGNHGTSGSSVTMLPSGGPLLPGGKTLGAAEFSGTADANNAVRILDSTTLDFNKTQGTIMFWIKPTAQNPESGRYCFVKTDPFNSSIGIEVAMHHTLGLFGWPYGFSDAYFSSFQVSVQTWQHITYTWITTNASGDNMHIYMNSVLDTQATYQRSGVVPSVTTTGDWVLGLDVDDNGIYYNRYYIGLMADFAVFDKALSPNEIFSAYSNGIAGLVGDLGPPPPLPEGLMMRVR